MGLQQHTFRILILGLRVYFELLALDFELKQPTLNSFTLKPCKMKKPAIIILFLFAMLIFCGHSSAQKVYKVKYESQADLKVFVVDYESQCDLKVFHVKYESQASKEGLWYSVDYESQADYKLYFVDYESQAELKIYYVDYESQAGWKNKSKAYLLKF